MKQKQAKYPSVKVCDAAINPFITEINLSVPQKIKVTIIGLILGPIRFITFLLLTVLMSSIGRLTESRYENREHKPFNWWSRFWQKSIAFLSKVSLFSMGFHNVKFKGKLAGAKEAPIYVIAPHSSFIDAYSLGMLEYITVIARHETEDTYLINGISLSMKPIIVKRTVKGALDKTTTAIHKRVQDGNWPPVVIFPEGTCTNRQALITFKIGAFKPGLPVQPIIYSYPNKTDFVSWTWKGPSVWKSLFCMVGQFHNYFEIEALPVYYPSEEEKADPRLYARNVRSVMAKSLNVPWTDHTFEDGLMMYEASMLKLPKEAGMIEFDAVKPKLNINVTDAKVILKEFAEIDTDKDGIIDCSDIANFYGISNQLAILNTIFKEYDKDNSKGINFKSYLFGRHRLNYKIDEERLSDATYSAIHDDNYTPKDKLKSLLSNPPVSMSHNNIEKICKKMAFTDNNTITLDDFTTFLRSHPEITFLIQYSTANL